MGIYLSTDNGDQWIQKNNGLKSLESIHSIITYGNILFAASSKSGVYLSLDNGNSWIEKSNGLTQLYIYSLIINDNYIFAGTWGGGIFRAKLTDFGLDVYESQTTDNSTFTISPNPTSDYISISFNKGACSLAGNRSISINNSMGIEMKSAKVSDTPKVSDTF